MTPTPTGTELKPRTRQLLDHLSWPRVMELGLAFVLGGLTLLLIEYGWRRVGDSGQPSVPVELICYRIDLNQARSGELAQLPGIGPALADRIVAHRKANGPFTTIDGLREVKGIGSTTVERLRPRLQVGAEKSGDGLAHGESDSRNEKRPSGHKPEVTEPININRASRDELVKLPGIGKVLAERIVADREANGPYRHVNELKRIKGIKDKMLEKMLPSITVGEMAVADGETAKPR